MCELAQGARVEQQELHAGGARAHGQDASLAVEGHRGTLAAQEAAGGRHDHGVLAERTARRVRVAHVRVAVHVVRAAGSHERVLRDGCADEGSGNGRAPAEARHETVARALANRGGVVPGAAREPQREEREGAAGDVAVGHHPPVPRGGPDAQRWARAPSRYRVP